MTQNRRSKRAIRSRMAYTGEKYTEARRSLLASGGDRSGGGDGPEVTFDWSSEPMGWFTDQAHNLILLAEDEARMLSHPRVEPEHLLLATARRGNVEELLPDGAARAIHDAIVRVTGFGEKLELRPRRSSASGEVLNRAVGAAHERGVVSPSSEHLLLALGDQKLPARILAELGVPNVETLVDTKYTQSPVDQNRIQRRVTWLATRGHIPPSPGPIPPIFERFTSRARDAIKAAIEHERRLNDPYLEPVHLLLGVLDSKGGVAATVRSTLGWEIQAAARVEPRYPNARNPQATEIFTDDARRIVAEDVLVIAERLDHRPLTTGHLLIALLEHTDERTSEITSSLHGPGETAVAVAVALPGEEDG